MIFQSIFLALKVKIYSQIYGYNEIPKIYHVSFAAPTSTLAKIDFGDGDYRTFTEALVYTTFAKPYRKEGTFLVTLSDSKFQLKANIISKSK